MTYKIGLAAMLLCVLCPLSGCFPQPRTSMEGATDNAKLAQDGAEAAESASGRAADCPEATQAAATARKHADAAQRNLDEGKKLAAQADELAKRDNGAYRFTEKGGIEYRTADNKSDAHFEATRQARDRARMWAGKAIKAADDCAGKTAAANAKTHSKGEDVNQQLKGHHAEPPPP